MILIVVHMRGKIAIARAAAMVSTSTAAAIMIYKFMDVTLRSAWPGNLPRERYGIFRGGLNFPNRSTKVGTKDAGKVETAPKNPMPFPTGFLRQCTVVSSEARKIVMMRNG